MQKKMWDDMAGRRGVNSTEECQTKLRCGHVLQRMNRSSAGGGWLGRGKQGPTHVQRKVSSQQESGFLAKIEMFASLWMAMPSLGLPQGRSCITHVWVIESSPALGQNKESK